mmetsp:Transcript_2677/g.5861  ORF Transcript_2677/g.5861 Transcript_2677/m.5861 type:complete len:339 (-) Transcript_2677:162-1178(-)
MVQVYNTPLRRRYYANRCSAAYCFFLLIVTVVLLLPFFMAYSASGADFWVKHATYLEEPTVKYNYKLVLILEGTKAGGTLPQTLFFSTLAPLNSMCQETLRVPVLRTQEVDGDMDGRAERLDISAQVPVENGEAIYSAKMMVFFEYELRDHAKLNMETMGFMQASSPLAGQSLFVDSDLEWHQTWPLSIKGGYSTPYGSEPLLDLNGVGPWDGGTGAKSIDIPTILKRYRDRNYTTELSSNSFVWEGMLPPPTLTNGDAGTFNITATVRYPQQVITYQPSVSEVLFDAGIKYLFMFVVVYLTLDLVCAFVFHHQLVDTYVHTEGVVAATSSRSKFKRF